VKGKTGVDSFAAGGTIGCMAFDHYLVCDQCRSARVFFNSRAGGVWVDASLVKDPLDFWRWMSEHKPHGIRVSDDDDPAVDEYLVPDDDE
jgi:hypothetical protein